MLMWARTHGCPWDSWTTMYAAIGGYFDMLKWAHTNGGPLDEWTCYGAADRGHLEILKWLRENEGRTSFARLPKPTNTVRGARPWSTRVYKIAMDKGYQDIVDWLLTL